MILCRLVFLAFLFIEIKPLYGQNNADKEHLSAVLDAFLASDSAKEQNLFCKGNCHLAKFSHRLTSLDIEGMGARTLLEVLSSFPGLFIKKDHFGRPSFGLYGMLGQNRIQILVDGVRQNDPYDGSAILNLPAWIIDYIDVYYGPGGTWFGEGSLLGVISVFTKRLPEIRQFGHIALDKSLGGGFLAIIKNRRIRSGAHASFLVLNPKENISLESTHLSSSSQQFAMKDLSASFFIDCKIAAIAQAHILARTSVSQEFFSPDSAYGFGNFEHKKLMWNSDIHLLKKRAQKNTLDLFFSAGVFRGLSKASLAPRFISESYNSLRFELGTKFHVKPFHGHDLFFGLGGILPTIKEERLFVASLGYVYGFIQDEWQIRAPFLITVGSRLILPIESKQFKSEVLPNIGIVLIPINKLRFTVAFQTSMRSPTFYEQSDRRVDAMVYQTSFNKTNLISEKSRTIESSLWYGDKIGDTHLKTSLAGHLSKISDAVSYELKAPKTNKNEIYVAGLRLVSEVSFNGGHSFSLGIFYSRAIVKNMDSKQSSCRIGFFSTHPCPNDSGMPRLMLKASAAFDLASTGGLNLATSFATDSKVEDLITEPLTLFEATYLSKPLWRYLSIFATAKTSFFGYHYREPLSGLNLKIRSFSPNLLAFIGWNVVL